MALALLNTPHQLSQSDIQTDGGTQSRTYLNHVVVDQYAEAMLAGAEFPPIVVYHDGSQYWLADGFHRLAAWRKAHIEIPIPADVRQGTRRDAILYSVGANSTHGLPRTNEDKRRAVLHLLEDAEWSTWSDREIARRCNVSDKTVGQIRKNLTAGIRSDAQLTERTYTTKHGTTATMRTGNIGRSAAAESSLGLIIAQVAEAEADKERCDRCGKWVALHALVVAANDENICQTCAAVTETPPASTAGKRLVDWTDDDWAAHRARVEAAVLEAAVLEAADVPAAQGETAIVGFDAVKIARAWLNDYRNKDGITWRGLSENQIIHANSPCYQEFCKAHPGIHQPKVILTSALGDLRRAENKNRPDSDGSTSPAEPQPMTDADRRREIIQTAVEDCQRILSRPAYLDAIAAASRAIRADHNYVVHGLRTLAATSG